MADLIAVTGASGELGGRVARLLGAAGVPQRLVVRDPARAPRIDGAEVAVAVYEDQAALRAAVDGVRTVLLVSAGEDRERLRVHQAAVRAIAAAGVERVVYTSFMGAAPQASFPFARDHAHTERAIREAGMQLTALRNSLYADFVPRLVGQDGVIRGPAADGRVAWVAREDVARLATVVLRDPTHAGQIYDVSGPAAIDLHATAEVLSEVTGRTIAYHPETVEEARRSRAGAEDWLIEGWIGSYLAIATGEAGVTSHTVEHLTGRRPLTLEETLRAEPATWRHLARA
jgi:NAD(P)H dehydrogenase (quinone)